MEDTGCRHSAHTATPLTSETLLRAKTHALYRCGLPLGTSHFSPKVVPLRVWKMCVCVCVCVCLALPPTHVC
jgi:hypothetical protein